MLVFRQLFDPASSTYTYLLGDTPSGEAVLIDPVFDQVPRDAAMLDELGLTLVATLETHLHADHITGAWLHRQRSGSRIALSRACGASGADLLLGHGELLRFGGRHLEARATPGHTNGCTTYVLDDQSMAFTGDCLLVRGCGRTDLQQGDASTLYRSVHQQVFTLPEACLLYPGHDYRGIPCTSVAEEKRFNPRLGCTISEEDFAGFMANLHLPQPRLIAVALPANLRCGEPADAVHAGAQPDWATLTLNFAGIREISPRALQECRENPLLLDVREPAEFDGPLGHLRGAVLVPLGELQDRTAGFDRSRPVVAICRSGARSAQATVLLQKAGFDRVANLAGGMLRWRADGHPVEGGSD